MELPIQVWQEIFSFLGWRERLKCKLVSKFWKLAIETSACPPFLCIYGDEYPRQVKWCFSDQNVIEEDAVRHNAQFCDFNLRIELFKGLQKLAFVRAYSCDFLKDLPLLTRLKVLMLHNYYINDRGSRNHRATLESSSLERLSFKYPYNIDDQVDIDSISIDFNTPNLSSLIFWSYSILNRDANLRVKFLFPLKVRHLECIKFFSDFSVLKNLETLVCQKIVCPFTLKDFKSLKQLELFPRQESELEAIKEIMNQKKILRLEHLEILVWGFKDILVTCKSEQHNGATAFDLNEHFLGQFAEHSNKLIAHIPREFEFNINLFVFSKVFKEIPNGFFKKFTNIYSVHILDDSDHLDNSKEKKLKLSQEAYLLQLLTESNPKVVRTDLNYTPEFYQEITSIRSIQILEIQDEFSSINYELFLKLKFLRKLDISSNKLQIDFIEKLFKLKYMQIFSFFGLSSRLSIRFAEDYCLTIMKIDKTGIPTKATQKSFDLDDLIKEMRRLKKKSNLFGKAYLPCLV